jgi:hypothetical protein
MNCILHYYEETEAKNKEEAEDNLFNGNAEFDLAGYEEIDRTDFNVIEIKELDREGQEQD